MSNPFEGMSGTNIGEAQEGQGLPVDKQMEADLARREKNAESLREIAPLLAELRNNKCNKIADYLEASSMEQRKKIDDALNMAGADLSVFRVYDNPETQDEMLALFNELESAEGLAMNPIGKKIEAMI
jgi:hypothetical protein